jgi:hypothetical protein
MNLNGASTIASDVLAPVARELLGLRQQSTRGSSSSINPETGGTSLIRLRKLAQHSFINRSWPKEHQLSIHRTSSPGNSKIAKNKDARLTGHI